MEALWKVFIAMLNSRKIIVKKNCNNKRLDIVCTEVFSSLSRKKIKSIIDNGGVYLNKKRVKIAKYLVFTGNEIEIYWDDSQPKKPKLSQANIVFENELFIIINKPAGIAVQGTLESDKNTLIHSLNKFDAQKYPLQNLFLVHRLDKDTSGLMILAKTPDTQKGFEGLFRNHKIEKTYKALCYFTPKEKQGIIKYPIAKDPSRKNTYFAIMTNKKTYPHQKSAETEYFVENTYKHKVALIVCKPKTGRTHQIRVHLQAIGCPIVGDKTYAQNVYGHPCSRSAVRHLLHATELSFEFDNKLYSFKSELPEEFQSVFERSSIDV